MLSNLLCRLPEDIVKLLYPVTTTDAVQLQEEVALLKQVQESSVVKGQVHNSDSLGFLTKSETALVAQLFYPSHKRPRQPPDKRHFKQKHPTLQKIQSTQQLLRHKMLPSCQDFLDKRVWKLCKLTVIGGTVISTCT